MAFVQAKCDECGGILAVDDCQETSTCPFCDNQFNVKEAIKNYYYPTDGSDNNEENNESKDRDFIIVKGTLKSYLGTKKEIVVPAGVEYIGKAAFKDRSITSITMQNGVVGICNNAFKGCLDLETVIIPGSVTQIGGGAFDNCRSLKSVVIPDSVTEMYDAFSNCTALIDIKLSNNLSWIHGYTFYK